MIRWIHWILFYSYMLIVPYCYVRIFLYRHKKVKPGTASSVGKKDEIHRKHRNFVTFKYNISIWLMEIFAVKYFIENSYLNFKFEELLDDGSALCWSESEHLVSPHLLRCISWCQSIPLSSWYERVNNGRPRWVFHLMPVNSSLAFFSIIECSEIWNWLNWCEVNCKSVNHVKSFSL